jgi:S-adenosylmethionine hydrolase
VKSRRGDTATRRRGDKPSVRRVSASPRLRVPLITLLTDFGAADYFVGAMKGVILSINPNARVVDITHEIPPQDIAAGAFNLLAAYKSFPAQTIHVAVVDPGVGSARRPILVTAGNQFFVGPDNGIFSYIIGREPDARVFHLTNERYFQPVVSATFHGRDLFAPVAAALSTGVKVESLGVETDDYARLEPLTPEKLKNGNVRARIIHIDRFGNCITNLTPEELMPETIAKGARLNVNGKTIKTFRRFFAEQGRSKERLFAVWGSSGFLEIAAMNQSAAKMLKARRGQTVLVSTRP